MWHFATKCAAVKFIKPWISRHFFESRDHSYVGSAICPECPRINWRGKSCWLHPRGSGPKVDQEPGGVTTSPTLLGPVLVWSQQNYLWLLVDHDVFRDLLGLLPPRTLPIGKAGANINGFQALRQPFQSATLLHSWTCISCSIATECVWKQTVKNELLAARLNGFRSVINHCSDAPAP